MRGQGVAGIVPGVGVIHGADPGRREVESTPGAAHTATMTEPRRPRSSVWLAGLVALAVVVRMVCWSRAAVMMNDGPDFLWQAQRLLEGDLAAALAHPYHPLYAALTALVGLAVPDLALAAVGVSIASGVLLVVAVHGITRHVVPRAPRVALAAAGVAALSPRFVGYAADVQSDGLAVAWFAAGLWALLAVHARGGHVRLAVLAGACGALAYLTRPEGLFLVVPALLLVRAARVGGAPWRPQLRALAAFGVVLGGLAAPYVSHVSSLSGRFVLTLKPSFETAGLGEQGDYHLAPADSPSGWPFVPRRDDAELGRQHDGAWLEPPPEVHAQEQEPLELERGDLSLAWPGVLGARQRGPVEALATVGQTFLHAARLDLLLLAVPGALVLWRRRRPMAVVLLGTTGTWLAVGVLQVMANGYLTNRHFLLGLLPLLPLAGLGVGFYATSRRLWMRVLLGLVLVESLRAATDDQRQDKLPRLQALAWVAEHTEPEQWIFTHRHRDSWYAGRRAVATRMPVKQSSMVKRLRELDAPYLVYDLEDLERHQPGWLEKGWVVEVARFGEGDETVLVLEPAFPEG